MGLMHLLNDAHKILHTSKKKMDTTWEHYWGKDAIVRQDVLGDYKDTSSACVPKSEDHYRIGDGIQLTPAKIELQHGCSLSDHWQMLYLVDEPNWG